MFLNRKSTHSLHRLVHHASKRPSAPLLPLSVVAMDIEYLHLSGPDGKEIVMPAQVCMVRNDKIVLYGHIRVPNPLLNCPYIGGIRSSDDSVPLVEMKGKITEILTESGETCLVGHNLRKDLAALGLDYSDSKCYDTMDFGPFQSRGKSSAWTLKRIAQQFLSIEIQAQPGGPHDIVEDTRTVYELFVRIVMPSILESEEEFLAYHEWMLSRSMKALQQGSGNFKP